MSCPKCAGGLPPTVSHCPSCGGLNPIFAEDAGQTMIFGSTQPPESIESPTAVLEPAMMVGEPPLGLVALYAESSEPPGATGMSPVYGRVFALRKGEVFLAGKLPYPEVARADSSKTAPIAMHLFPMSEAYGHVSRKHMTLEFTGRGEAVLFDFSTNGLTLVRAGAFAKNGRGETKKHVIRGDESVILGIDATRGGDPVARERSTHCRIDLFFPWAGGRLAS